VAVGAAGWTGHRVARSGVRSDREALATQYLLNLEASAHAGTSEATP